MTKTTLEKIIFKKMLLRWEMKGFEAGLDNKPIHQLKCTPQAVAYFGGYLRAKLIQAGK